MKKLPYIVLLVTFTVFSFAADRPSMSYKLSKALADRDERSLSDKDMNSLITAQGAVGGRAVSECISAIRPSKPIKFALVMELDSSGRIVRSWLDSTTPVGICFKSKMDSQFLNRPPVSPFYTVFEFASS